jgi:hypothetical protein
MITRMMTSKMPTMPPTYTLPHLPSLAQLRRRSLDDGDSDAVCVRAWVFVSRGETYETRAVAHAADAAVVSAA